jgi:hypothetical protein
LKNENPKSGGGVHMWSGVEVQVKNFNLSGSIVLTSLSFALDIHHCSTSAVNADDLMQMQFIYVMDNL